MKKTEFLFRIFAVLALLMFPASLFAYELPAPPSSHTLQFQADETYFYSKGKVINLKGHVVLDEVYGGSVTKTIMAEEITVDISSQTAVSPGKIVLKQNGLTVTGDSGEFDYEKGVGIVRKGRLKAGGVIFEGKKLTLSQNRFVYRHASLTTCDYIPPHYRITSSLVDLEPERRFIAFNNFMFIGKIPVFYFPVLYKPMGKGTPFISSFYPGYNERNGFYLKSNYMYRFTPFSRGKIYLDYFSRKGFGTGGEYNYHRKEKNLTNISYYRIREYGNKRERQGMSGGFWHYFGAGKRYSYYGQSFFRWLSDPGFNNDYFRDNPFSVSAGKEANVAFTLRGLKSVMRVSAASKYTRNSVTNNFEKSYESAPKLEYSASGIKFRKLPFVHNFNFNFQNSREENVSYYQKKGGADWNVTTNYRISKSFTFYPSFLWNQAVMLSTSAFVSDKWVGRWQSNLVLRYDRLWGNVDLNYFYRERLKSNKLKKDIHSSDSGEEKNSFGVEVFVRPNYRMYFRGVAEYDLRNYISGGFTERLSDISAEFYVKPSLKRSFFIQDVYSPSKGNQSFVAEAEWGQENYLKVGVANYKSDKNDFFISNKIGFAGGKSWRVEGVARYRARRGKGISLKGVNFYEKSFVLYKDFHDFRTNWRVSSRNGVKEFSFFVNLKWNPPGKKTDKADRYWHPWRSKDMMRD